MLVSPMGLRPEKGCAGDARQKLKTTDTASRQRGRHTSTNPQLSKNNQRQEGVPDGRLTPRQTGRLTVSGNITLTLVHSVLRASQSELTVFHFDPVRNFCNPTAIYLIVGFCILLCVYSLTLFLKTTVRNNVFSAPFYCALLTTCFGPDRWPSSGNMYIKFTKVTTVYVDGSDCYAFQLSSRWLLTWFPLWCWWQSRHVPPKRRMTFNGLHGVISQKRELFRHSFVDAKWPERESHQLTPSEGIKEHSISLIKYYYPPPNFPPYFFNISSRKSLFFHFIISLMLFIFISFH
jgi:hypothetical protein